MRSFRFTIAGLMGAVAVVAVGLTAMRPGAYFWASVAFLTTVGILLLSIVGVVCGRQSERAWWLGFSLFGWGYLALAFYSEFLPRQAYSLPGLPTSALLARLQDLIFGPSGWKTTRFESYEGGGDHFMTLGHSVFGLVFAALGGLSGRRFFGTPVVRSISPISERQEVVRSPVRWWRRPAVLVSAAACVLSMSAVVFGAREAPGHWAGLTVLLTWAMLGLAVIAAVFGRGKRRAACLGAVLFGAGYLVLVSGRSGDQPTWPQAASVELLNELRPWLPDVVTELPGKTDGIAYANARAFLALDQRVSMTFGKETPLADVLKQILAATRGPTGRVVPIYIDPVGLQEAKKTMQSPVTFELEDVPLRTSLRLILRQVGLAYYVKDGLIMITSEGLCSPYPDRSFYDDPFLVIGQCVLAWLASCLGGVLAPLVSFRKGDETSRTRIGDLSGREEG